MESPILHVDMDAFFAAVEQRDNSTLLGKPVIVGGSDPSQRGVVSAASYEARSFGVHSAMPLKEAKRLCPQGVFLSGNHSRYNRVSDQFISILYTFTPLVEKVSIDEAFLDVSGCGPLFGTSKTIAEKIKHTIKKELLLTASVGVAPNKLLSKIASDLEKPDGLVYVREDEVEEFLRDLPIGCLFGVGKKMAQVLQQKGIYTIGELSVVDPILFQLQWGRLGKELIKLAKGIDDRPVLPAPLREKSIGHEITFPVDLKEEKILKAFLLKLSAMVSSRMRRAGLKGRTITLKVRYADFKTVTRRFTFMNPTSSENLIYEEALGLFASFLGHHFHFRLLGISMSNLVEASKEQLSLFSTTEKEENLMEAIDVLRERYGERIIKKGGTLLLED